MFFIDIRKKVDDFLDTLPVLDKERILKRLKRLEENPVPSDAKFIKKDSEGDSIFRYRVGSYRFLYIIDYKHKSVIVLNGDKRDVVYNNLNGL